MDKSSICIAADVQNSSRLKREGFIDALSSCSQLLNESFAADLLIPFDVRNGDELVGVLKSFSAGYLAAEKMLETLQREEIYLYVGAGLGQLDRVDATAHTMNGSAVLNAFRARDQYLKKQDPEAKTWRIGDGQGSRFFFYSDTYPYAALNALAFSIRDRKHHRTDKQREVIKAIHENPDFSYEQIGKKLGYKSPKSTVSYLLSRADYHVVGAMEESLGQLLDDLQKWFVKEGT